MNEFLIGLNLVKDELFESKKKWKFFFEEFPNNKLVLLLKHVEIVLNIICSNVYRQIESNVQYYIWCNDPIFD